MLDGPAQHRRPPRLSRALARVQALAPDPVGVRVPAFPQRQFGLPLGHHVPGRETDCGQPPARPEADFCSRAPDVPRRSSPSTVGGMGPAAPGQ
ncbi:hypothetical protein [Streptomyces mirabilis]|uniref:hypothetical protein n=1 Tax=Streptomyces mirabilis TaxID=68239 RepID=UPI0039A680EB